MIDHQCNRNSVIHYMANWSTIERRIPTTEMGRLKYFWENAFSKTSHRENSLFLDRNIFLFMSGGKFKLNLKQQANAQLWHGHTHQVVMH